jgi:hypothetical protein
VGRLSGLLENWREQVGQTFLSATSASFCWPEMPECLLGRLESLPHGFFSSLLVPVVNRFDNYPRLSNDSVGRAGNVTSIVATPRPKLAAARLGLVKVPI